MATWIVHLRIAEGLLGRIPGLDAEKFALGNVAPDSGKPDERWENFTPPPQVTHFQNPADPEGYLADLEFFRGYLHPLHGGQDAGLFSFRLGYFFHLVTDNLWMDKIGHPTREKFRAQFDADRNFIWEVKKDWYGLDFIYLREHPNSLFWRVFRYATPERGGLDFLLQESLAWSVAHIQQYYQATGEEVQEKYNRLYIYLSQTDVDHFVATTILLLEHIYHYLWIGSLSGEGYTTALVLPDRKEENT